MRLAASASSPSGNQSGLEMGKTDAGRPQGTVDRISVLDGSWRETGLFVLVGSLLLLAITQPAFHSFFFAENFIYLGQYRSHGSSFWRAVFSPNNHIFFRPVFFAVNLPWHFVLPVDPWVFHLRNFGFTAINLLLLHRVLLRLVMSWRARAVAFFLFAVSKVHLTTIGYIEVYDSIVMLMLLLLTILFFLRYVERQRAIDYGMALLFCFLSIFSKDYGLVVVGVLAALVGSRGMTRTQWQTQVRWWALRFVPILAIVILYLGVRHTVLQDSPSPDSVYYPQLSLEVTARKLLDFTSTMGNLSFSKDGTTGGSGLGTWVVAKLPGLAAHTQWIEAMFYVAFMGLLLITLSIGRRAGWMLIFPLTWAAVYFGPTLLTRNSQMYYMYESLAGIAVLLGICLDRANRRLIRGWLLALVLIFANGATSNYTSAYLWQFTADQVQRIQAPVLEAHRGEQIRSLTFITSSQPFWQFALTADSQGPMLQELMNLPELRVSFVDYRDLQARQSEANDVNLFFDIDNGFLTYPDPAPAPLFLRSIAPPRSQAGKGFSVQPDGQSALSITAEHATRGTYVFLGETRLQTTFGNPAWLTALVPSEVLMKPGRYPVYLSDGIRASNQLEFIVSLHESAGPDPAPSILVPHATSGSEPPFLRQLTPASTSAGLGFNIQPNEQSAISVDCENATPATIIIFGATPLVTTYGNQHWLTALIPAELYARPGRYQVHLKNESGESNRIEFEVKP